MQGAQVLIINSAQQIAGVGEVRDSFHLVSTCYVQGTSVTALTF